LLADGGAACSVRIPGIHEEQGAYV